MAMVYYDNLAPTQIEDAPGFIEVERIYCFDWDRFSDRHWDALGGVYEALPGDVRHRDVPWWFGEDEESQPFLWASVEPPGLQVYGVLLETDWLLWDEAFRSAVDGLPMRVLR